MAKKEGEHFEYRHSVEGPAPHVHSVWLYWLVFSALILFTVLTLYLAQFDLGKFSIFMTLLIASTKACLVMAFFMHLWFDNKFFAMVISTSLIFLALFIIFPIADFDTRKDVDSDQDNFLPRNEKVFDAAKLDPNAPALRPGLRPAEKDKLIYIGAGEH